MLNLGGTAPLDPFTETATGLSLVLLLAGVAFLIKAFTSRPVLFFYSCAAFCVSVGFIGGIVAGAI